MADRVYVPGTIIHAYESTGVLPPSPDIPPTGFDDCGTFLGPRECEVRVYDKDGNRKFFELEDWLDSVDWERLERGGCGAGTLSALATWSDLQFVGNEQVDIYLFGLPAYRGFCRMPEKEIASPERATLHLNGLMDVMGGYQVTRKFAYGCDTDLSIVFQDIVNHCVKVSGRQPNIVIEIETIGVTVKELDARGKTAAEAFNMVCDTAPNVAIWGCDMDDTADWRGRRESRVYIRTRKTAVSAAYAIGDNVTGFTYPVDVTRVRNRMRLTGGKVTQKNLLVNGSFEEIAPSSETVGNWLQDYSFEDGTPSAAWTLASGATVKYLGHPTAHGSAKTGHQWLELDNAGESGEQVVPIIPGDKFTAIFNTRYEDPVLSAGGQVGLYLDGLDASNVQITTLTTSLVDPGGSIYKRYELTQDWASFPTVVKARVKALGNSGSASNDGILVDDVALVQYCAAAQKGWRPEFGGVGALALLDWTYVHGTDPTYALTRRAASPSGLALKMQASGVVTYPTDFAGVRTEKESRATVAPNERYTSLVFWQGASVDFTIGVQCYKSDGTTTGSAQESQNVGTVSVWTYAGIEFMTPSDAASVEVYYRLNNNNAIYLDDGMLIQSEVPDEVRIGGSWWDGETYQAVIDVTDSDLTGLSAAALSSITDYGIAEEPVSQSLVTDRASFLVYAGPWLNAHAVPQIAGHMSIEGPREQLLQDGTVKLIDIANRPKELFPSRVRYKAGQSITMDADLGNDVADSFDILRFSAQRARQGL